MDYIFIAIGIIQYGKASHLLHVKQLIYRLLDHERLNVTNVLS